MHPSIDWARIRHFTPAELPDGLIDPALAYLLDDYREFTGHAFIVHDVVGDGHAPDGEHPKGRAVDGHVVGMTLIDAWLAAERFPAFMGIGLYPYWIIRLPDGSERPAPGLHLDIRTAPYRARWWCGRTKTSYRALDATALVAMMRDHAVA